MPAVAWSKAEVMMQGLLGLLPDHFTDDGRYGAWHQRALPIPAAFAIEVLSFIDGAD